MGVEANLRRAYGSEEKGGLSVERAGYPGTSEEKGGLSAEGAEYDSQGQVTSAARNVAPGSKSPIKMRPERPK